MKSEAARLPLEVALVWALFLRDAVAILVTYSRLPAHELYHVSGSGLQGGLSRVIVDANFPSALAAIAVLLIVFDRARRLRTLAVLVALPWIFAELGFFLDGVPLLHRVFETGAYRGRGAEVSAERSRRQYPAAARRVPLVDGGVRPRKHGERLLDGADLEARLDELAVPERVAAVALGRLGARRVRRGVDPFDEYRVAAQSYGQACSTTEVT